MSEEFTPVKVWKRGLIAAAITGMSNGISLLVVDGMFDVFENWYQLLTATIATTLIGVSAYLKQSPLPYYDFEGGKNQSPLIDLERSINQNANISK